MKTDSGKSFVLSGELITDVKGLKKDIRKFKFHELLHSKNEIFKYVLIENYESSTGNTLVFNQAVWHCVLQNKKIYY